MLVAAPALSGDGVEDGKGQGVCRNDGAWIGESPSWGMQWTAMYTSESHWKGSYTTRWIGGDPTLGGFFPSVVAFSNTVGTWIRTGRRTFEYTMITYGVDASGLPVYIAKNSGSSSLTAVRRARAGGPRTRATKSTEHSTVTPRSATSQQRNSTTSSTLIH